MSDHRIRHANLKIVYNSILSLSTHAILTNTKSLVIISPTAMENIDPSVNMESYPSTSHASSSSVPPDDAKDVVRILRKDEYKAAAKCLAEAFEYDDVAMYFIKTGPRRKWTGKMWTGEDEWALHLFVMECIVYAHCLKGLATTVGPQYDCVALW